MKKHRIHFLLLFALLFNIVHASIIAIEDECHEESVHTYILEQSQSMDCGDICDIEHLFHFIAIVQGLDSSEYLDFTALIPTHQPHNYHAIFSKTSIKPPIV